MDRSRPLEERRAAFRRRHDWERFVARPTRPPTLKLMVDGVAEAGHGRGAPRARATRSSRRSSRSSPTSGSSTSRSTSTERICGCRRTSNRRRRPGRICRGRERRTPLGWTSSCTTADPPRGRGPSRASRPEPRSSWTRSSALVRSSRTSTSRPTRTKAAGGATSSRRRTSSSIRSATAGTSGAPLRRRAARRRTADGRARGQRACDPCAASRASSSTRAAARRGSRARPRRAARAGRPPRRRLPRSRRGGLVHHGRRAREWLVILRHRESPRS